MGGRTLMRLAQPEERGEQRRLARARAAAHAHERARRDREGDAPQRRREARPVAHAHVLEDERAALRPRGGRRRVGGERRLLWQPCVGEQPLHGHHLVLKLGRLAHEPLEKSCQPHEKDERRADQARVVAAAQHAARRVLSGDGGEGAGDE